MQGVLILARPNGIILRSTGSLFALPSASAAAAAPAGDDEGVEGTSSGAEPVAAPTTSETARAYAKAAVRMVEAVGSEVREIDEDKAVRRLFLVLYCAGASLTMRTVGRPALPANPHKAA